MTDIRAIVAHTRWMTSPEILKAAQYIEKRLHQVDGLSEVRIERFKSDGKTAFGGWIMPKCWDVKSATLVAPARAGRVELLLADYRRNPFSLMMWSPPTPKGGIEAEVVVVKTPFKDGKKLKGKIALFSDVPQIATPHVEWAASCGALAFVTDTMIEKKGIKEGKYLDDAVQYWNYSNPQWDGARRLPAFGLTPALGRKLRALIAKEKHVLLRAKVDSQLYNGVLPLVTAALPGAGRGEFVLTAHMDEPGASDNTSGTAIAMEIMRVLAQYVRKRGGPLPHTVRFLASVEARGLQAHINLNRYGRGLVGGMDLDMLGYDQRVGRAPLEITSALPAGPSGLEFLLCELAAEESKRKPAFKFKSNSAIVINDCQFAGAPFDAPMCALEQAPDRTYHCSLDRPENLSSSHIARIGGITAEATRFFAENNADEIQALGERVYAQALSEIQKRKKPALQVAAWAGAILNDLAERIDEGPITPTADAVAAMRSHGKLIDGYLAPKFAFEAKIQQWKGELKQLAARKAPVGTKKKPPLPPAEIKAAAVARTIVPVKTFGGYLAFEDLSATEKKAFEKQTGLEISWAAPGTIQHALDLCNGKRTLLDIHARLAEHKHCSLALLVKVFKFLERHGKIRRRKVIYKKDVLSAIRAVGIRSGDLIVAHSSLSDFGYLEGGAEALVDALLEAVGPAGTLCVPTHSLNWIGKPPYDPKTSPSLTGIVPLTVLRRPNVQRSLHPTHSVASIGPLAAQLLDGHDANVAPQAREGFWGKFVDAGGKVLMLCKLGSNTLLHGGELWAGIPYPPCQVHYLDNGRRVEQTTPGMPWHTHAFTAAHDRLRAKRRLFSAKLGESVIYSMSAREAVEAMMAAIHEDPHIAIFPKCNCAYCNYLREHLPPATARKSKPQIELAGRP